MKTADEIYQEMCAIYADNAGVSVRDGSDMAVRLYTTAAQIESLYVYNDWVKDQCFPRRQTVNISTATLRCGDSVVRRPETPRGISNSPPPEQWIRRSSSAGDDLRNSIGHEIRHHADGDDTGGDKDLCLSGKIRG